jgi:hypothetical protein
MWLLGILLFILLLLGFSLLAFLPSNQFATPLGDSHSEKVSRIKVKQINETRNIKDTDLFMMNMRDAHYVFFRNLRKEGYLLSSVIYQAFPLLIPLNFYQETLQLNVNFDRLKLHLVDTKLRDYNLKLQKTSGQIQKLAAAKKKLEEAQILQVKPDKQKEFKYLEYEKNFNLKALDNKIEELEGTKRALEESYNNKELLLKDFNRLGFEEEIEENKKLTTIEEKLEKNKGQAASLAKEISFLSDVKANILKELDIASTKANLYKVPI